MSEPTIEETPCEHANQSPHWIAGAVCNDCGAELPTMEVPPPVEQDE